MEIIPIKCPQCAAPLDDITGRIVCLYCGSHLHIYYDDTSGQRQVGPDDTLPTSGLIAPSLCKNAVEMKAMFELARDRALPQRKQIQEELQAQYTQAKAELKPLDDNLHKRQGQANLSVLVAACSGLLGVILIATDDGPLCVLFLAVAAGLLTLYLMLSRWIEVLQKEARVQRKGISDRYEGQIKLVTEEISWLEEYIRSADERINELLSASRLLPGAGAQ
jgi:hypothetical protein